MGRIGRAVGNAANAANNAANNAADAAADAARNAANNAANAANNAANGASNTADQVGAQLTPILQQGTNNASKGGQYMWSRASAALGNGVGIQGHVENCLRTRGFSPEGAEQLISGNLPNGGNDFARVTSNGKLSDNERGELQKLRLLVEQMRQELIDLKSQDAKQDRKDSGR